jgi:hypothetical protein
MNFVEPIRAIMAGTLQPSAWISVVLLLILFLLTAIAGWSAMSPPFDNGKHRIRL